MTIRMPMWDQALVPAIGSYYESVRLEAIQPRVGFTRRNRRRARQALGRPGWTELAPAEA